MLDSSQVLVILTISALGALATVSVLHHCCHGRWRRKYKAIPGDDDDDITVSDMDV
jgi:hypothetical protein